jgi:translation elongation factor EF-1alpha
MDEPCCMETFRAYANLGRVTLRSEGNSVFSGMVMELLY